MPTTKELTNSFGGPDGTLGKVCQALAERNLNVLAFQSLPAQGNSVARFVVDNATTAKQIWDNQGLSYAETDVAQVKLSPAGRV